MKKGPLLTPALQSVLEAPEYKESLEYWVWANQPSPKLRFASTSGRPKCSKRSQEKKVEACCVVSVGTQAKAAMLPSNQPVLPRQFVVLPGQAAVSVGTVAHPDRCINLPETMNPTKPEQPRSCPSFGMKLIKVGL